MRRLAAIPAFVYSWLSLALMVAAFVAIVTLASWFTNEVAQVGVGTHGEKLSEMPKPGEVPDYPGLREHREYMRRNGLERKHPPETD